MNKFTMLTQSIGILAAVLTTFGFVPQIIKMLKTRSARDVSIGTFLQFFIGVALWVLYGVYRHDSIIIYANSVTLITLTLAITLYFRFHKKII